MLAYQNAAAAIDWLQYAFGFQERIEMRFMEQDRVTHAELALGDQIIMLATPSSDYESINEHRKHCKEMDRWLSVPWVVNGVLVYVDDIDQHFEKASNAGAEILSAIERGFPGDRYRCADLEGQRWMFMQKERDGI